MPANARMRHADGDMNVVASANPAPALKARYILHERLGLGGQGEVWRARDPERGVDIALKILRPVPGRSAAAWATVVHEHESASRLDHPYILKVFPPEREDGVFLLPMQLAPGGDLRRLRGAGYLAIVPVLLEVAQALEHAHERGVIHRDLKPGNVLFDARGRVQLADFGVSGRAVDAGMDAMVRGLSPFTASPEQLRGEPPTPADDIYGLGALAYELLSRYPPHYPHFDAQRVQQEPVPPLVPAQQIPPQLDALINRMLAKKAKQRPASMREVIEELEAALNDTLSFDSETAEPPREALLANATRQLDELSATHTPGTLAPAALSLPAISPHPEPPAPAPARAPVRAVRHWPAAPPTPGVVDGRALWEEVREAPLPPRASGLEPMRSVLPPVLLVLAGLAAAALAAYFWLPRHLGLQAPAAPAAVATAGSGAVNPLEAAPQEPPQLEADRARLDRRLAALEARSATVWGGPNFAAAKRRAAESVGARDGGSFSLSQQRLTEAALLLDAVERSAPAPKNVQASAQLAKANAPSANESYAADAGEGFAALGAGRLEEARAAFERARALRPDGPEAADGLRRVNAAAAPGKSPATQPAAGALPPVNAAAADGKGFAAARAHALDLESQERWEDALLAYNALLRQDGSLALAHQGKARVEARQDLDDALQAMLDRPDRLANSQQVRDQASALLQEARAQPAPGPVLSSQIERLTALLPNAGKPVHVALVSDGVTQVEIPSVGTFGSFSRRDIQLRPGHYTVIGTREGYRDTRRDIVVSPERENQTVIVRCSEPT